MIDQLLSEKRKEFEFVYNFVVSCYLCSEANPDNWTQIQRQKEYVRQLGDYFITNNFDISSFDVDNCKAISDTFPLVSRYSKSVPKNKRRSCDAFVNLIGSTLNEPCLYILACFLDHLDKGYFHVEEHTVSISMKNKQKLIKKIPPEFLIGCSIEGIKYYALKELMIGGT